MTLNAKERRTNHIQKLKDTDGSWMDWVTNLQQLITRYYQDLFSTATNSSEVIDCVIGSVSQALNRELLKEIFDDEVKASLFQMNLDKALGPDGMAPDLFQKHWNIVGKDIIKAIKEYFATGDLLQSVNDTNIVLIPKKKNPTVIGELRPIALCNVLMKIITKVMANGLKEVINDVVSETQSAFISGRLISDNIMTAYEVMHYLRCKKVGKDGFLALKLDMSKAYDRIEWDFLRAILLKRGFSTWWCTWFFKVLLRFSIQ
ncbi:hypothetical protein AgCh_006963 [Apium graveolens]